jgi:hypothetical protein
METDWEKLETESMKTDETQSLDVELYSRDTVLGWSLI